MAQYFENVQGCDSIIIIRTSLLPQNECGFNAGDRDKIYIPNSFSPNYDGINDIFYVMSLANIISDIQWMRIYDRWGNLITEKENGESNDPSFGWDGTMDGALLNPSVFVWQVHLTYADGKERTLYGDVMLVR